MFAQPKLEQAEAFIRKHAPVAAQASTTLLQYGKRNPRAALRIAGAIFFGLVATKCEIHAYLTHEITGAPPKEIWAESYANRWGAYVSIVDDNPDAQRELVNADALWRKWDTIYIDQNSRNSRIANGIRFFRDGIGKYWIEDIKRAQAPQKAAYDAEVKQHDIGVKYQWSAGLLYLVALVCAPRKWLVIAGESTVAAVVGWVLWILLFGSSGSILGVAVCAALIAAGVLFEAITRALDEVRQPTILGHSRFSKAKPASVSNREV